MNKENTVEEVIDHGVYEYEDTDPKRMMSDLSVDFTFIASTELDEAIEIVEEALKDSGLTFSIDMWTTPQKD
tara:strand:- start:684 stop:899 length:216 start_codon:yes stop_codon:yes gene_type:complete